MPPSFKWPKEGDRAFKASFPSADRERLDAFLMPSDGAYVVGYQDAADIIVDAAQKDDLNTDNIFFPVAYLYRHHLELMLKGLVGFGLRVGALEKCEACMTEHNLHILWNKAKQLIQQVWPDSPAGDIKAVEQVILEFHKLDPSGQVLRYARDKEGNQHLRNGPERVDLLNLKKTVQAVSAFLDGAYAGFESCDPGPP
jgi:hypothetical protein